MPPGRAVPGGRFPGENGNEGQYTPDGSLARLVAGFSGFAGFVALGRGERRRAGLFQEASMREMRRYAMAVRVRGDFGSIVRRTVDELAAEGFGVLTEIDVSATLKKKLGAEFRPYLILGACNPPLAHRALMEEPDIGVLLPCNVVVWANDDETCTVTALDPVRQFSLVDNPRLEPVAREVHDRLGRVLDRVCAGGDT